MKHLNVKDIGQLILNESYVKSIGTFGSPNQSMHFTLRETGRTVDVRLLIM